MAAALTALFQMFRIEKNTSKKCGHLGDHGQRAGYRHGSWKSHTAASKRETTETRRKDVLRECRWGRTLLFLDSFLGYTWAVRGMPGVAVSRRLQNPEVRDSVQLLVCCATVRPHPALGAQEI